MSRQYCKVGSVTPLKSGGRTQALMESHYETLMGKAIETRNLDTGLREFFESKAKKIQRVLQTLS